MKALILVNVGTTSKPEVKEVRKYLTQFLNDRRVIDLPWLGQKLLVNGIIVPFRAKGSTELYKRLWTADGSPLLIYMNALRDKLQELLKGQYEVYSAMRYGEPALKSVLAEAKQVGYDAIEIFPLFPQYASSTTGTVAEFVMERMRKWYVVPELKVHGQFYDHPAFIEAFADNIRACQPKEYDHIVFSYHGLPNRQIDKVHPNINSHDCRCEHEMPHHGKHCYRAACYATTRSLAKALALPESSYSTAFQSRLSKNWLTPFTDRTLEKLAANGTKKVLVAAPAFVADCLETTVEIGYEYAEMFREKGGEKLTMVPSLNASNAWAKAIVEIIA